MKLFKKYLERILIFICKKLNIDLYIHGLIQKGLLINHHFEQSGELNFLKNFLPKLLKGKNAIILFDVGANEGEYAIKLHDLFPGASILCFEPVPATYRKLIKNKLAKNISTYNIALGGSDCTSILFNSIDEAISQIATSSVEALKNEFDINEAKIKAINVEMQSIDSFCKANNVHCIDFLKIDVEGAEINVLRGAKSLLEQGNINVIQFEFNFHNIYNRIFLRDFYQLLPNYSFFRITRNSLLPLGEYSAVNEIFILQNIIAIKNEV